MKNLKTLAILSIVIIACSALKTTSVSSSDEASEVTINQPSVASVAETATLSIPVGADTSKWVAPASSNELKNSVEANEESIEEGMLIYKKNCRSCHGKLGDGKGMGAEDCEVPVTDFTKPAFAGQSDGAMFWKIQQGRNDMESYKDELEEEEIWNVIIYMRTFSKPSE